METITVLAGATFDAGAINKTIFMIQPVGFTSKAQLLNKSVNANKSAYAVDGVYTPANDANASDIDGIRVNEVGWSKIAVPAGVSPVMITIR